MHTAKHGRACGPVGPNAPHVAVAEQHHAGGRSAARRRPVAHKQLQPAPINHKGGVGAAGVRLLVGPCVVVVCACQRLHAEKGAWLRRALLQRAAARCRCFAQQTAALRSNLGAAPRHRVRAPPARHPAASCWRATRARARPPRRAGGAPGPSGAAYAQRAASKCGWRAAPAVGGCRRCWRLVLMSRDRCINPQNDMNVQRAFLRSKAAPGRQITDIDRQQPL